MSNSIDRILEKIKGIRETLNGDFRIIGEEFEFIFYKSNDPGTEIETLKSFN
ncbi:SMI1/KNR4 family protein, partial [Bacillus pseudomycoides]